MHSLDKTLDLCLKWTQIAGLALFLSAGNIAITHGQTSDSGASANAGASSGDGSSNAGANSSAGASAGPNDEGGVSANSNASTGGSADGGDTSASGPGISAEASATSGDAPTAETSTSAGTWANSTAGDDPSAVAGGGTVLSKQGPYKGYAISYQDGAYSAAYYRGDTASVTSGVYTGETLTKKDARAIVRNSVRVGATANRTQASAWAEAETNAKGAAPAAVSAASTRAKASAWADTNGTAGSSADAGFSASFSTGRAKQANRRSAERTELASARSACGGGSTWNKTSCHDR
ncbi:MAG: hypothetical protein ACOZAM_12075 [Pseudomonadota bacterium]